MLLLGISYDFKLLNSDLTVHTRRFCPAENHDGQIEATSETGGRLRGNSCTEVLGRFAGCFVFGSCVLKLSQTLIPRTATGSVPSETLTVNSTN
jgi:hypothetical protein